MLVNFSERLRLNTIEFCDDELNYHINDSGCADEYDNEICCQIEILYLLGKKKLAKDYMNNYRRRLTEMISEEGDWDRKKELKELKHALNEFWKEVITTPKTV